MMVRCPSCGYEFVTYRDIDTCPACGSRFDTSYGKRKSSKPAIAGVLLIIVFVLGLFTGILIFLGAGMLEELPAMGEVTVYGIVKDENGRGVEGARVSIEGEKLSIDTKKNGSYRMEKVPIGVHRIKVTQEGYQTAIKKVFIMEEAKKINFVLKEGKGEVKKDLTKGIFAALYTCGIVVIIFSFFALLGAVFALLRKKFGLAVLGAVLGIPSFGLLLIGPILAVVALILLVLSRDEFE